MLRKTLTIFSLIGLLLSVGLWGVSYFRFVYAPRTLIHEFDLSRGALRFQRVTGQIPDDWRKSALETIPKHGQRAQRRRLSVIANGVLVEDIEFFTPGFALHGFESFETLWLPICSSRLSRSIQHLSIAIPLWIPTALLGVATWLSLAPLRQRRKRMKLGLCLKCGYDLRGSAERCPECGAGFSD